MATCLYGIEGLPIETVINDTGYVRYKDDLISCDKITDAIDEQIRFDYGIPDDEIVDAYVFLSWFADCKEGQSKEDQIIDLVDAMRNVDHSDKI